MAERIPISAVDRVQVAEVFEGLLNDEIELTDLPESFHADGKDFFITTDTVINGIKNQLQDRKRTLEHQLANATIDNGIYRGVSVISAQQQGRRTGNDQVLLYWQSKDYSSSGNIELHPATSDPEAITDLIQAASPETIEEYRYYIEDILKDFAKRDRIVSHQYSYNGWSGNQWSEVTEKRSSHTQAFLERIEDMLKKQKKLLKNDFSVNLSLNNMATEFYEEMNASADPELYAAQFASSWLELRFQQEIALHKRRNDVFQRSETKPYEPGSVRHAGPFYTTMGPNENL